MAATVEIAVRRTEAEPSGGRGRTGGLSRRVFDLIYVLSESAAPPLRTNHNQYKQIAGATPMRR